MSRPNLVLISIECWRYDHFGVLTPNLVRLGEESVIFRHAYSSGGWTLPSMIGLMSSSHASMHGGTKVALASPRRETIAERLLQAGYWTAGFTSNPVCGGLYGFHRGFGTFRDERQKARSERGESEGGKRNWRRMIELGIGPRQLDTLCEASQLTNRGMDWLACRGEGEPFFLWLHYMEPHWPCLTPDLPADEQQLRDEWSDRLLYRNEIIPARGQKDPGDQVRRRWISRYQVALAAADREIGRLLDYLRSRSDWGTTMVAVVGDHGEEFYEHGVWHHSWNRLYREGIHVPLIVRIPGNSPKQTNHLVSHLDIAPTFLEYADAGPGRSPMMGRSLRPLIEGREIPQHPIYSEMLGHYQSAAYRLMISDGEWKYIYDIEDPHNSKLFRIADDPGEQDNVRDQHAAVFRKFEQLRLEHVSLGLLDLLDSGKAQPETELDELMKEQMIALGYMVPG
jgi:arylsulfatase A-like enzyme